MTVNPHESLVLYHHAIDYFGTLVQPGSYLLQWNLTSFTFLHAASGDSGLTFQLKFWANKNGQVADTSGIASPIFPLKIGDKWTYLELYLSADGTVYGGDTVTSTISTEVMINGEKWFLLNSTAYADR